MSSEEVTLRQILDKLVEHDSQFAQINHKLVEHDSQFAQINHKLVEHDSQFTQINHKLVEHDSQFTQINRQLANQDQKLANHDRQFHNLANQILNSEGSIKAEIARLDERIDGIHSILEKQTGDLERLTQEYHMITVGLKRLEEGVDQLGKAGEEVRIEVNGLKDRMSSIEKRVLVLEAR